MWRYVFRCSLICGLVVGLSLPLSSLAASSEVYYWPTLTRLMVLRNAGKSLQLSGAFLEAEQLYQRILPNIPEGNFESFHSDLLIDLGNVQAYLGKYDKASEQYFKALRQKEQLNDLHGIGKLQNNIGLLNFRMENLSTADAYFQKSLSLSQTLTDSLLEASVLTNLGYLRSKARLHNEALQFQLKASGLYQKIGDLFRWSNSFINIGLEYEALGNMDAAIEHYQKAAAIAGRNGYQPIHVDALNKLGRIQTTIGAFQEGRGHLEKAYGKAKVIKDPALLNELHFNLYENYAAAGDLETALDYYIVWSELKDSLVNLHNREKLLNLETLFQSEQQAKEIALLSQKNGQQRLVFVSILSATLIIAGMIFWLLYRSRIKAQLLAKETELHQKEKELLESQLVNKNQELSAIALQINQKKQYLARLLDRMEKLADSGTIQAETLVQVQREIRRQTDDDQGWVQFQTNFDQVHSGFLTRLAKSHPQLSLNDKRHCAYIRMELTTKEIAGLMHIHPGSVQRSRGRLKKKLQLPPSENLIDYLLQF